MKRNNSEILISVIMGIYNCETTLEEAVMSIVNQTEKRWELILCDDGSIDRTYEKACFLQEKYTEKIVVIKNEKNLGLNETLNRCLRIARGKYIARMDGDDRCSRERFEKELKILEENKDIAIVSTDMEFFDETGVWGYISHPKNPEKKDFLSESPFCHAPCMVRKEAYDAVGGYSVSNRLLRVEDYHLWVKMHLAGFKGENIPEPLYQMRDDRNAYSRRKIKYRLNEAYVKCIVVRKMQLPIWSYVYALRPIIVGLLPTFIYDVMHKRRLNR